MSVETCGTLERGWDWGEVALRHDQKLGAILRSVRWSLASSRNPRRGLTPTPAGIAHTFAVCMLEIDDMARGKTNSDSRGSAGQLPKFVDVKLSEDDRRAFLGWSWDDESLLVLLQRVCDAGYRVGCSWSGTSQSYTVSLTGRDSESPNNGLCMTSFARTLEQAVALAMFKHFTVSSENWGSVSPPSQEDFG